MANIGANTNHPTGTGRSYNTPEKQFGKEIGQAEYQAKPEFASTLEDKFGGAKALSSKSLHEGEAAWDLDAMVVRGKEMLKSAGGYVRENRRIFIGAAVALSAVGVGAYLMNQRKSRG